MAHVLAIFAFTLIPVGLLGIHGLLRDDSQEPLAYRSIVLSLAGIGLALPFYGAETYGLQAIGEEALRQQSADVLRLAAAVRSGVGLALFLVGLLLLAVATLLTSIVVWKSGRLARWSGVPLAIGMLLYLPQFFWSQPFRVAHGLLVAIGCLWLAVGLWRRASR